MIDKLISDLAEKREMIVFQQGELEHLENHLSRIFGKRLEILRQFVKRAKEDAAQVEAQLKDAVLDLYKDGKIEKKPHAAVQVKQWTVLSYDPQEAFDHCLAHLPGALSMKKVAFEKVAKVAELDFVEIGKEDRVSIKTDLSAWLPHYGREGIARELDRPR